MSVTDLRPPRKQKAQESELETLEFVRREWRYTAPHGLPLDLLKQPDFWSHVSRKLRSGDLIEVLAADGAYDCEYRVVAVVGLLVHLRTLREWVRPENAAVLPTGEGVQIVAQEARVEWCPAAGHKWRVVASDGSIPFKGGATRDVAEAEMHQYIANLKRQVA